MELTNQKFGRLTAIEYVGNRLWRCKCECGNECFKRGSDLKSGSAKSCGCLHIERIINYNKETKIKRNKYDLSGEYGIGWTCNTNEEFYFDLEDYDKIKDYCWNNDDGYICSHEYFIHRLIMGVEKEDWRQIRVDHIRHNKLDNRKSQLRICNATESNRNVGLSKANTSGITGVCWDKKSNKWKSYITVNYNKIILGWFDIFEEAVASRKAAEEKYFREYSYDNSMKHEVV